MKQENCWLQISSGRGPLECCWVVYRLFEEIVKKASANGVVVKIIENVSAEKSKTSKSILLELHVDQDVEGDNDRHLVFAKQWQGTIQWVGTSQFRPTHKRKNWFVGVDYLEPPEHDNWCMEDIKIETMRAGGSGGQHVNKTESAVRIIYLPTKISVTAREERSQHQNKKLGLARLSSMLKNIEEQKNTNLEQSRWQLHNELVRGNPVKIYCGKKFVVK